MNQMTESIAPEPPDDVVRRQTIATALHRTALRMPSKTAIVCGETSWTYAEFDALVSRLAAGLNHIGVGEGDNVAVVARNSHAFTALQFALARRGAVMVPVNFEITAGRLAYTLRHAGVKTMAVDSEFEALAREASALETQVRDYIWLPSEAPSMPEPGMHDFNDLCACTDFLPRTTHQSQALAQIVYSAGADALPKGIMVTHDALLWQSMSCIISAEIANNDVILHAQPLYHCTQLNGFLGPGIYMGCRNVITAHNTPDHVLAMLEKHRITSFFAPPSVWISMLVSPQFEASKLPALAKGYFGGNGIPLGALVVLLARLPNMRLWNLYGQSEMVAVATVLGPDEQLNKHGSCGKSAHNVETRVVNEDMQDVAVGEVGEIVHRSPQAMLGYHKDPESTATAFAGNWLHSGDLATVDNEGYISIVDRKKDMVKTGGQSVSSRNVEDAILGLPQVSKVAVIGLPHPDLIEMVTAVVVLKPGQRLEEKELMDFCAQHLAPYKVPKRVIFTTALPRKPSGNVLKRTLRTQFSK